MPRTPPALTRRRALASALLATLSSRGFAQAGTTWRVGPGEAITRVADALRRAADGDTVDATNLQRQILHRADRIGMNKVASAKIALAEINPDVVVEAIETRLEGEALAAEVARADLVLDCCDNFTTRQAINRACVHARKPLVSGAAIRFTGQLAVFDLRRPDAPCYECLFPEGEEVDPPRCATTGVFAPLTGIIGSLQAAEALRLIVGCGDDPSGRFLRYDALRLEWRTSRFKRDPDCAVCGG